MVLIHTTIKELDEAIAKIIPDSRIAYYPEYLLEEKEADTVVLSYRAQPKDTSLKDFLFALRCQDKRIIFLMDSEENPLLGYVLALGIYDILFSAVTPKKIKETVESQPKFSNVARLFLGLKKKVSFTGSIEEESEDKTQPGQDAAEPEGMQIQQTIPEDKTEAEAVKTAKGQIKGVLKLLKAESSCDKTDNINEMLVALEDAIVDFASSKI